MTSSSPSVLLVAAPASCLRWRRKTWPITESVAVPDLRTSPLDPPKHDPELVAASPDAENVNGSTSNILSDSNVDDIREIVHRGDVDLRKTY